MKSVLFLFNHDAAHQVSHMAGMAAELSKQQPEIKVVAAVSNANIKAELIKSVGTLPESLTIYDLSLPLWLDKLVDLIGHLAPIGRITRLRWHNSYLRRFDIIASTERTCLMLKRRWGINGPRFIHLPHGAGDRNVTHHPEKKDFDLFLLSGTKMMDQMIRHGIATAEQCRIIGYPKFDDLPTRKPEQLFANNRPSFLYNPHFDPHLSSWYEHGPAILEWFYQRPEQYNLIFAPHVMLFRKELHISPEYKLSKRRPGLDEKYRSAPNILIDTDSERLFDMSYTLSADAYIGDVSSQIYEFLIRPRPCYFVDTHSAPREEPYDSWNCGPVLRSAEALFPLLDDWQELGQQYKDVQVKLINHTFDYSDPRPAAVRGAEAIANYLRDTHQWANQSD